MSIELDPRNCDQEYIIGLAKLGYKRLSFGVQDTSSEVQTTINRVQCSEHIAMLIRTAYEAGFTNINVDLIVGLPNQSLSSIALTIQEVLSWDVERITVFNYAHLPHRFAAQRKFREDQLPASEIRQSMSKYINQHLNSKGYVNIGMDHYAKPEDPLVKAMQQGALQRNFQGYTADNNSNILGFGVSSISTIEDVVAQNPVKLKDYYAALQTQTLHNKGLVLSKDDRVRRQIISELMCNYQCDLQGICAEFAVDMALYFADELATLVNYHHQGLLEFEHGKISVKQVHRSLIRVIASTFDVYYIPQKGFSKVI
jgi:oxygen-independent coproporphyrinogen-3 oxidase